MFASENLLAFLIRFVLLIQMLTVYPMLLYIIRVQLFGYFYGTDYPSRKIVLTYAFIMPAVTTMVASVYPNVGIITSIAGAVCGLYFIYLVPPLIHMGTLKGKHDGLTESIVKKEMLEVGTGGTLSYALHSIVILIGVLILIFQFVPVQ
jgi:sodium-coupled neutral amino acid transporter 9